jgi:hypothetical protein
MSSEHLALSPIYRESFCICFDAMWSRDAEGVFFSTPQPQFSSGLEVVEPLPPRVRCAMMSAPLTAESVRTFQATDAARRRWAYLLEAVNRPSVGAIQEMDVTAAMDDDIISWRRGRSQSGRATIVQLEAGYSGGLRAGDLVWLDWTLRKMMVEAEDFSIRERLVRAWCCVLSNRCDPAFFRTVVTELHNFYSMDRARWFCSYGGGMLEGNIMLMYGRNVESTLWMKVLKSVDDICRQIMGDTMRDETFCYVHAGLVKCPRQPRFPNMSSSDQRAVEVENWSDSGEEEL